MDHLLTDPPIWVTGAALALLLFLAAEFGMRLGRRARSSGEADNEKFADVLTGTLFALFGLLLAFTYSYTLSRADARKDAVIMEANALGTAFLRAGLVEDPALRRNLQVALRDYARSRHTEGLAAIAGDDVTWSDLEAIKRYSLELQARIWPAAVAAIGPEKPQAFEVSLLNTINAVLDAGTVRMAAVQDRLPTLVLGSVALIAGIAIAASAHASARSARPIRGRALAYAVTVAAVITLILDFDQPDNGVVGVSHESIAMTVQDMETALAGD